MAHKIVQVEPRGVGDRFGLRAGDAVLSINGEPVIDEIDYQALTAQEELHMKVQDEQGNVRDVHIQKEDYEPMGLHMAESMVCSPMLCKNNCTFCFVAQMPKGHRPTLYVKDDDWRMSLMMGNFITLTNVSDEEFDRIIRRQASPLNISVHTTDMLLRKKMMRNPNADQLMDRLRRLKEAGLHFHCQVVLVPGVNDGPYLEKTIRDLKELYPAALTAALVPVGLTKYRENLAPLDTYKKDTAKKVLDTAHKWQEICLKEMGTRFVFPADEFYCIAGEKYPDEESYEGYPQIENGIGMLRQFEEEMKICFETNRDEARKRRVLIACGTSVAPVMKRWIETYGPTGAEVTVQPILNDYFGHTVTVTGLITGQDLIRQLKDADTDEIMISGSMLRNEGDLFLDDLSLEEVASKLPAPLTVVHGGGDALFDALMG